MMVTMRARRWNVVFRQRLEFHRRRRRVLVLYSRGVLPRSTAMDSLGLVWYGQLLDLLAAYCVPRPQVSRAQLRRMRAVVAGFFQEIQDD